MTARGYLLSTVIIFIYISLTVFILFIGGPVVGNVCRFAAHEYWQCRYEPQILQLWGLASSPFNLIFIFILCLGWVVLSLVVLRKKRKTI